jgi:uncharacterized coiled-coil protein SlyX
VTDELDHQIRQALQRRRRSPIFPVAVVVFAIAASGLAYAWVNYGDQVRAAMVPASVGTAPGTASGAESRRSADFEAFKSQTVDYLRSINDTLDAQKAELQKLSDQVSALVAKVDSFQRAPVAAQSPAPPPPPIRNSTPAQPITPPKPSPTVRNWKPPTAEPNGPISVGGAPLPPATAPDR